MSPKNKKSLMTHIVLGYPSLTDNKKMIRVMSDAGVDYIEMQIPFSDPIADGKTIMNASQHALKNNISVSDCFRFATDMAETYRSINFLFMTYYNIIFSYGTEAFIKRSKSSGLYGLIVPDLPVEHDRENYFSGCAENQIHPVYVVSPTTETSRLKKIKQYSSGFIYCTSRIGTTGADKNPHDKLEEYIRKMRKIIDLPVAVGFGIDSVSKAKMISGFADIIVIGSKVINIIDESGAAFEKNIYGFLSDIKKNI